jgi:NADH-quinone oxidoreductase subunit N
VIAAPPPTFDLSIPAQLTAALAPDVLLLIGATFVTLWAAWRSESVPHQRQCGVAAIVVILATMAVVIYEWVAGVTATPGIIAVDPFRWASDMLVLIAALCTIALSLDYNGREGILAGESHGLVLFATSGMMLLSAARDMTIVFLGIELMSVAVYILAGLNRRSSKSAEGALKYFLLGAFSTGFLLYGMALIYGGTGATNLATIAARLAEVAFPARSPLILLGIALLLVGFGFKVAAAPFHMWAPDVYEGAPTPITAFMAAAVKAAAFAAFLRIWIEAFPYIRDGRGYFYYWHNAVWALAITTMIVGNVLALAQRNIKRMLAYSSIAHAGYVLAAVVAGSTLGASAYLFYLLAYTLATMGAFAVVIALGNTGEAHIELDDYAGLWTTRPWLAVAMSICMLALLGFPIVGGLGFLAKWYILEAALQASGQPQIVLATVLVLTTVISAGYYLRVIQIMFMRPRPAQPAASARAGLMTEWVVFSTVLLLIGFGLAPQWLVDVAQKSAPIVAQPTPTRTLPPSFGLRN